MIDISYLNLTRCGGIEFCLYYISVCKINVTGVLNRYNLIILLKRLMVDLRRSF